MSKKKAFGGNTMTLKDFHGGSIPSDLPLPSAPGVSLEWTGYDRPNSRGGPMGRPDHRARPNSLPATRHFDDKTPFLSHTTPIGRHFDEDERKPLDGGTAPRRTISDDSFQSMPSRVELRPEPLTNGRVSGSAAVSQASRSYPGRVSEGVHVGKNSQNLGGNIGQGSSAASHPNVWAARKELAVGVSEPVPPAWSGACAVSKLANASALEKVSSGRWQSKHSIQHLAEVVVVENLEFEKDVGSRGQDAYGDNRIVAVTGGEYSDATLARHLERGFALEDGIQSGRKEYVDHERTIASSYSPLKDKSIVTHAERVQPFRADVRSSGCESQASVHAETSERPRVKLLPRTKPLEGLETPIVDQKEGYQKSRQLSNPVNGHTGTNESHGHTNAARPSSAGLESDNPVIERPKFNLKPRSQPIEQSVENREKLSVGLFGGARPREVVLKERGIDGAPISNHDLVQQPERVKHNVPKTERGPDHAIPAHHAERTDNMPMDQRTVRNFERKEQRTDNERADKQRRNWRNDNWRNSRENNRQQHSPQPQHERPHSPETWRKPLEPPQPASPDTAGRRHGKVASALELAQAFSKSFKDPKPADKYSGQGSLPGKSQMPFSRLTSPTPRPQINGY